MKERKKKKVTHAYMYVLFVNCTTKKREKRKKGISVNDKITN